MAQTGLDFWEAQNGSNSKMIKVNKIPNWPEFVKMLHNGKDVWVG